MAINFRKYVDITSGIGAGASVARRDLIGRLFSTNPLIPTKSLIEFDDIESVLAYFGSTSEEYKRAAFYFGWISKNITRAKKIAFARWADVAVAAQIFGDTDQKALATFTAISDGTFILNVGEQSATVTGVDLSGAVSLAAVAALIEDAIQLEAGSQFTDATVVYNATRGSFDFTSGDVGTAAISVEAEGTGTDLLGPLGWTGTGAILSDGADGETITDVLTESADASNNFGTFLFIPTLTIEEIEEAAIWNNTQNILYMFMVPTTDANASAYSAALIDYAGVAITLSETADEYPEMIPMIILAATDYTAQNSVQNYMYQIFAVTPGVTTTLQSNALDALRVNYYGRTQTAGQQIDFYQRGTLTGLPVSPSDMNVYANEIWLKDAVGASIMELLLALAKVSANAKGRIQIISQIQAVIGEALRNGTISVGKILTNTQKLFIGEITNDPDAWQQVQTIGYWLDCEIQRVDGDPVEYKAVYTLVYSKDDVIRKVEGRHVLI
ncbi:MAG: DUF3383 domain-containing protein [Methylocystis sp.]|uniref:DUF3383 domain-containing protein n=1 Tax=Methylocystis sp. TaxID=1911079 RepID=UPI003DA66F4A